MKKCNSVLILTIMFLTFAVVLCAQTVPAQDPAISSPPLLSGEETGQAPAQSSQRSSTSVITGIQSGMLLTLQGKKDLSELIRGILEIRALPDRPRDTAAIRRIINTGRHSTKFLRLGRFPSLPRFQASASGVVVRNRSEGMIEYRRFGDFQTRLSGFVNPLEKAVYADMNFTTTGNRRIQIKCDISRTGPLSGEFHISGRDYLGRSWQIHIQATQLVWLDSGLPTVGMMTLSGSESGGRQSRLDLVFPYKVENETGKEPN